MGQFIKENGLFAANLSELAYEGPTWSSCSNLSSTPESNLQVSQDIDLWKSQSDSFKFIEEELSANAIEKGIKVLNSNETHGFADIAKEHLVAAGSTLGLILVLTLNRLWT